MKVIVCLMIVTSIVGCAAPSKKVSRPEFMTGEPAATAKVSDIEANLTRSHGPDNSYSGTALLLTEPLIVARAREFGKRNYETEDQTRKNISALRAEVLQDKTCFEITLSSTLGNTINVEAADLKNWKVVSENPTQKVNAVNLTKVSKVENFQPSGTQIAVLQGFGGPFGGDQGVKHMEQIRKSTAIGCTVGALDFTQPIKLVLIPQFGDERFKNIILEWSSSGQTIRSVSSK